MDFEAFRTDTKTIAAVERKRAGNRIPDSREEKIQVFPSNANGGEEAFRRQPRGGGNGAIGGPAGAQPVRSAA